VPDTERCDLTDLLVDQCACKTHRGGQTVQEQADAERLALRDRLLGTTNPWFVAEYAGCCVRCREPYEAGAAIRRDTSSYLAECCAEEANGG
jgi:hypothetical protein